jgi:hypothetical protein
MAGNIVPNWHSFEKLMSYIRASVLYILKISIEYVFNEQNTPPPPPPLQDQDLTSAQETHQREALLVLQVQFHILYETIKKAKM